jgi:hypothetical protein
VAICQAGLRDRRACLWQRQFSGRCILGNNILGSLLLLTDNYIQQLRTKPQRHESTKDAQERFVTVQQPGDPCALPEAAPSSRRATLLRHSGSGCSSWPLPVGLAVRASGTLVRAGRIANKVHSASYLPVGPETLE